MRLVVTGATGFIGSALCAALLKQGHALTLLTRGSPRDANTGTKRWLHWTPGTLRDWDAALDGVDGVINLAGEPIAQKHWTHTQRHRIERSRIDATHSLVQACAKLRQKPKFLINASAVGYYGPRGDETITEDAPPGDDFLSIVCQAWEEEAQNAEELGMRVVRLRTGIVLGPRGGALPKMAKPFKFFMGGPLGSGNQWISWIQLEDLLRMILLVIEHPLARGPVNATAPNPVQNKEFSRTLGKVLRRPCWAPVPAFVLKLALGEMSQMLLTGQRVVPAVAEKLGFQFRYPNLQEALEASRPI
ncbi:MAG: TIGR01777 family oxidoreductase [Candidatus Binatia bacterium]